MYAPFLFFRSPLTLLVQNNDFDHPPPNHLVLKISSTEHTINYPDAQSVWHVEAINITEIMDSSAGVCKCICGRSFAARRALDQHCWDKEASPDHKSLLDIKRVPCNVSNVRPPALSSSSVCIDSQIVNLMLAFYLYGTDQHQTGPSRGTPHQRNMDGRWDWELYQHHRHQERVAQAIRLKSVHLVL